MISQKSSKSKSFSLFLWLKPLRMTLKKLFYLLAISSVTLLSCKEEEKPEEAAAGSNSTSSIKPELFAASVYQNMDTSMAIVELRLEQIFNDANVLDGKALETNPHPLAPMVKTYFDALKEAIDLKTQSYLIIDDFDFKKEQITEGAAIINIKNQESFDKVIKDFASINEVDGYNFANIGPAYMAWKNNIALVGFSNTKDGGKYVKQLMSNGLKLDKSAFLEGRLNHKDDIHVIIPGMPLLAKLPSLLTKPNQSQLKLATEKLAEDAKDSNLEFAINFEKGKITLNGQSHASEKILPLLNVLAGAVSTETINKTNTENSIGNVAVNFDVKKLTSSYGTYLMENKIVDKNASQQLAMVNDYLKGEFVVNVAGFNDDKKMIGSMFYTKKDNNMLLDMGASQIAKDGFILTNESYTGFFGKSSLGNVTNTTHGDFHSSAPITGYFDVTKVNADVLPIAVSALIPFLSTAEFKGDLLKMEGELKGKNSEENLLKTLINSLTQNLQGGNEIPM